MRVAQTGLFALSALVWDVRMVVVASSSAFVVSSSLLEAKASSSEECGGEETMLKVTIKLCSGRISRRKKKIESTKETQRNSDS